ncbi:hypothetical protein NDU88_003134 [Pleurodeles waltl]|uniref:Uncharacterized protein n=1 Tax=Pleurodeles waltl TaxID=8319 RepID=A0AAV7NJS8_PLEWA|nr:hypothetical protein NDU88_003134 [Pleurodeles waltl]
MRRINICRNFKTAVETSTRSCNVASPVRKPAARRADLGAQRVTMQPAQLGSRLPRKQSWEEDSGPDRGAPPCRAFTRGAVTALFSSLVAAGTMV